MKCNLKTDHGSLTTGLRVMKFSSAQSMTDHMVCIIVLTYSAHRLIFIVTFTDNYSTFRSIFQLGNANKNCLKVGEGGGGPSVDGPRVLS